VRINGDWEAWLLFFVDAISATAHQAVGTAQALMQLLAKDKARLVELGRLAGSARQILDALFAHPVSNIAALTDATGLAPATIGKALDAMAHILGLVHEVTGRKRNRVYAYRDYINILNQETT
jgi:Fic family protein